MKRGNGGNLFALVCSDSNFVNVHLIVVQVFVLLFIWQMTLNASLMWEMILK